MFQKRQKQIETLTKTIFESLEKAKQKRETKMMQKLKKSIEK